MSYFKNAIVLLLSHRGAATEGNLDTFDSIANSNPSIIHTSIIYRYRTGNNLFT